MINSIQPCCLTPATLPAAERGTEELTKDWPVHSLFNQTSGTEVSKGSDRRFMHGIITIAYFTGGQRVLLLDRAFITLMHELLRWFCCCCCCSVGVLCKLVHVTPAEWYCGRRNLGPICFRIQS